MNVPQDQYEKFDNSSFIHAGKVSYTLPSWLLIEGCNILKRVPNSALWLLRFLVAAEMRLHIYAST
ncbi:hypothetical protein P3L10_013580 [Capsicum annuum]